MTEEQKNTKGHCPRCDGERNADINAYYRNEWREDDSPVYGIDEYYVLTCRGCETVFVKITEYFSEDEPEEHYDYNTGQVELYVVPKVTHWPMPKFRRRPEWHWRLIFGDSDLKNLLKETYSSLDNGNHVLAAIGMRTVFDRISELLGIDTKLTFNAKLNEMQEKGFIGEYEKETLVVLIDAGSAAAHRGWKPSEDELNAMMDIIEPMIQKHF